MNTSGNNTKKKQRISQKKWIEQLPSRTLTIQDHKHGQTNKETRTTPSPKQLREQIQTYLAQTIGKLTGRTTIQETSHREYSDDAVLFLDIQRSGELIQQITNYDCVANGRQLRIQWEK